MLQPIQWALYEIPGDVIGIIREEGERQLSCMPVEGCKGQTKPWKCISLYPNHNLCNFIVFRDAVVFPNLIQNSLGPILLNLYI